MRATSLLASLLVISLLSANAHAQQAAADLLPGHTMPRIRQVSW